MPAEDGRDEAVLEGGEQVLRGCRVAVAGVSAVPRAAGNVSDLQGLGDAGFEPPSLPPTAPTSAPRPRAPGLCRTGVGWGGGGGGTPDWGAAPPVPAPVASATRPATARSSSPSPAPDPARVRPAPSACAPAPARPHSASSGPGAPIPRPGPKGSIPGPARSSLDSDPAADASGPRTVSDARALGTWARLELGAARGRDSARGRL